MEPELNSDSEVSAGEGSHEELLSAISSLGRKRRRVAQRSEAPAHVSEHHLDPTLSGGVSVGELTRGLNTPSLKPLVQRLSGVEDKHKPLATPLSRVKADQVHRGVVYEQSCKQTGKWAPIVKKNREAEHLSFPLQEERVALPSLSTKVDSYKPMSEFEREIAQVVVTSDHVAADTEELSKAEREALLSLSLEEAAERRKELRKMRALMSYYEQKARRNKKIKSKKFHRVQRKRREARQSGGGEEAGSLERAERLRAQERMTLKHSRLSKWAKQQLSRSHRDMGTQEALTELHSKRQSLKQKASHDSSSEEDGPAESETEDTPTSDHTSSANPWLNQTAKSVTPCDPLVSHVITTRSVMSVNSGGARPPEPRPPSQLEAVREAFAGDDVMEQFAEEKAGLLEESRGRTVDLTLPGWGAWGGEGIKASKRARKIIKKIPERLRKDANIKNVIISENVDKKAQKHLVYEVPWPYTSLEQFNKTHANPIGRLWNTEATFQSAIKPRVTTATGCVIEPIKLTEDVQDFMKRTERKKKSISAKKKK